MAFPQGRAASKQSALEYVREREMGNKVFVNIKKIDFSRALQANIEQPSRINQGDSHFCGPASILHALAKYHPLEYAQFAMDLYQKGHALVRGEKVDAAFLKDAAVPPNLGIDNVCDWVTMASLRASLSGLGVLSALTTTSTSVQGTYPFEIEKGFKLMGYTDVRNETTILKSDLDSFKKASALCKTNFRVVLCVNDNMFAEPPERSWIPRMANHFCTLKSTEKMDANIKCRVWQWGETGGKKAEPDKPIAGLHVNLPKEVFLENYFGFVAAGEYQVS